ncbi:MAG: ABC transporter ATP-binding protein [Thermoleophilia bacterium]|nr:ABC transporter ATP-binding protein [Thermoleophilia bacterium]
MAVLHLNLTHPLPAFDLELTLDVGCETVALVGPSGAGKTTVLRAIAGLVSPRAGAISLADTAWFDRERGIDVPPEGRRVGFLFQEYALFPHLTVRQNVAFGADDPALVEALLDRLRIGSLAGSRPRSLSGGERQRVALARALAREPDVLLLDEPLAALDPHTRGTVREELRELLHELRLPAVVVTHDYEDAAALADRIGVLVDGRLRQIGPAREIVASPSDPFVARFVGANVLLGAAAPGARGLTRIELSGGEVVWSADPAEGPVAVSIHPWEIAVVRPGAEVPETNHIEARVATIMRIGNRARVRLGPVTAELTGDALDRLALREGDVAVATFEPTAARLLPLA